MAIKETRDSWFSRSAIPADVHLHVHGRTYCLNRNLLVAKSGKLAILLKENPNEAPSYSLPDLPGNSKIFELAMRFCYGFEPNMSAQNVVPLICLAYHLEMTENQSPNNLLNMTLSFFHLEVSPLWNESVVAFQSTQHVFQQAVDLHLVDACLDSLIGKALLNPRLLGEPIENPTAEDDDNGNIYMPNARRRLFVPEWQSEDLTNLTLQLYEIIISKMMQAGVQSEYVIGSLLRYTQKWADVRIEGETELVCKKNYQREVIETMVKLLPDETRLLPCELLFKMLQSAIASQASLNCRYNLEIRIGKQLTEASAEDLLIPSQGYAREMQYDTECVKRILKAFYANYTSSDASGLITVAELIEEFLAKVASDADLKKETFVSLAGMSVATSIATKRGSDGIYHAIDIYLDKHSYLTESEREEVCQMLDCQQMSPEACTHAAQNKRLPLRVVVQALFVGQLHLREVIVSRIEDSEEGSQKEDAVTAGEGEEVRIEMEKMDNRVIELEKECSKMKRQIGKDGGKRSVWKQLKRKFGCISSMHDYNCQVKKKVHPRNGL